jgi:uncharacterized protein
MFSLNGVVYLSASDLVGHLNCHYLTKLDLAVARGELDKPAIWDPVLEVLAQRGALHEQSYLNYLVTNGLSVKRIDGVGIDAKTVRSTLDAMREGVPVIAQGALQAAQWGGRIDILRRVEKPSGLGAWSYEIVDTKLARETKGNTILQLCIYSDLLGGAQKLTPEFAYVVTPGSDFKPQAFRFHDYAAYYRRVRYSLERAVEDGVGAGLYPEPKPHCDICRWRIHCDNKRHADDHLSLVAGISKLQIGELGKRAVTKTAELATMPLPLEWKPERGAPQSYEKIREQARIQVEGRVKGHVIHEALPVVSGYGLTRLPVPSPGDVFFDLEGNPYVGEGGLEFLFGYTFTDDAGLPTYTAEWAFSRTEERAAFENFVDFVIARLAKYPDLHVYHYAPYEPAALKRLMGRYATRENEIDQMLRGGVFVDLYAVVRHAVRASVESYSIKKLEALYAFDRTAALADANKMLAKLQYCLELNDLEGITNETRSVTQAYNRDDCLSTFRLRDWLEKVRSDLINVGVTLDRPVLKDGGADQDVKDRQEKIAKLVVQLTNGVPVDREKRTSEQHSRWLLANVLDWHRREKKTTWWDYFRLRDLSPEDLLEERTAISGLTFVKAVGGTAKVPIHRYSFPMQDTDVREGDKLRSVGGAKFGVVDAISFENRTIDVNKRKDTAGFHPEAIFSHKVIDTDVLADALVRIAEYTADNGIIGKGRYPRCILQS